MKPEKIRGELKTKKIKIVGIAEKRGCSDTAVHLVIDRKSTSYPIMQLVAEALDKPIESVFPEYFKQAS